MFLRHLKAILEKLEEMERVAATINVYDLSDTKGSITLEAGDHDIHVSDNVVIDVHTPPPLQQTACGFVIPTGDK